MTLPAGAAARHSGPPPDPDAGSTALRGLTEAEVAARRAAGQGNTAPASTGRTYLQIIRENVFTFIKSASWAWTTPSTCRALAGRP